jgi:hypothetical protein
MSRPASNQQPHLNIFALPTRTTILFALIVLVVMLPVLASLIDDTPLCEPCLVFWMLLLPFWSFLRRPDDELRRHRMTDLAERYPRLSEQINQLISQIKLEHRPRLLLSLEKGITLRTFGTFTRHYLVIPVGRAAEFEAELDSSDPKKRHGAEAIILHELSHFANRDVVPTFFARSLLIMTIGYSSVSLSIEALTPFVYNIGVRSIDIASLLPPELLEPIRASNPEVAQALLNPPTIGPIAWSRYENFVLSAHWPLIVGSLFLLVIFWRALLRTRELYADARVAQWQGEATFLQRELLLEPTREVFHYAAQPRRSWLLLDTVRGAMNRLNAISFLATHPDRVTRQACLDQPSRIYGSDVTIGLTTGVTFILLNLALGSLLLSRYLRGPNAELPFVLGFTIISLSLLPSLCSATGALANLRRTITRSTLIFTGLKLAPQYLAGIMITLIVIIDPRIIDVVGLTLVGSGGESTPSLGILPAFVIENYFIRPAILFTLVMPVTLIGWLLIDARLKRRILTWYGAPIIRNHPVGLFWGLTGWLALVLWFVVVPIYNVVTVPTAHSLSEPGMLAPMFLTLIASAIIGGGLLIGQRRYAGRCPRCDHHISGCFQLGKRCPQCQEVLHPWLVAGSPAATRIELLAQCDETVQQKRRET